MANDKLTSDHRKVNFLDDLRTSDTAVLNKLIYGNTPKGSSNKGNVSLDANTAGLRQLAAETAGRMNDAANTFETLPETELAMQVLVASIASPNDMRATELTWTAETTNIEPAAILEMLDVLRDFFENEFKLKEKITPMLEDALFKTGSYPILIVPESGLDEMINGRATASMEAYSAMVDSDGVMKTCGLLGPGLEVKSKKPTKKFGLESHIEKTSVSGVDAAACSADSAVAITDNVNALKMPLLVERYRKSKIADSITRGMGAVVSLEDSQSGEERKNMKLSDLSNALYRNDRGTGGISTRLKTSSQTKRATVGHPLDIKLPSDCLIIVHRPGNPRERLGAFMLVDELGHPLSMASESSYYSEMARRFRDDASGSSAMLEKVKNSSIGMKSLTSGSNVDMCQREMMDVYSQAIELDLLERLKNGAYGSSVELSKNNALYEIMFYRSLSSKNTQLVYVPEELLIYVAFDYTEKGIGRSLIDKSKILASIRAVLLFSNTMASVKNSTNTRNISIGLDPNDPEPEATVEFLLTEAAKTQNRALPIPSTNPSDIIDGIRNAQTNVSVTGSSKYPETSFEVSDGGGSRVLVDTDLDEKMKARHLQALGVMPELVDSTTETEFAIESIHRNLMFIKRLAIYQATTSGFLLEIVRKYTRQSGTLLARLVECLNAKRPDSEVTVDANTDISDQLAEFFNALDIQLPSPDNTKLENQIESYENYNNALEAILPAYINEETMEKALGDEGSNNVTMIYEAVKGFFQRKYLSSNNILPELRELLAPDDANEIAVEMVKTHNKHTGVIADLFNKLIEQMEPDEKEEDDMDDMDGNADEFDEPVEEEVVEDEAPEPEEDEDEEEPEPEEDEESSPDPEPEEETLEEDDDEPAEFDESEIEEDDLDEDELEEK